ncbi:MAG: TerC family protein [Pseudomonadaceae bacterium]|nr:TerC family protein [Pseudomonadaceae bacterium]
MELLTDPSVWAAFVTLTLLEIVLGIDNIVFISILTSRLPVHQQARARFIGLGLAMIMRIGLLFSIAWIMRLTVELFTVFEHSITGRDLILILGGGFLIAKAVREIHNSLEGVGHGGGSAAQATFVGVLVQIAVIDMVFSLDSVITAVGLAEHVETMVAAIVVAVAFMMVAAGAISSYVERHPTIKMLALAFLVLIGFVLLAEGLGAHVPKGYVYFAMAFAVGVEMLNIRGGKRSGPLKLRPAQLGDLIPGVESAPEPASDAGSRN